MARTPQSPIIVRQFHDELEGSADSALAPTPRGRARLAAEGPGELLDRDHALFAHCLVNEGEKGQTTSPAQRCAGLMPSLVNPGAVLARIGSPRVASGLDRSTADRHRGRIALEVSHDSEERQVADVVVNAVDLLASARI